MNPSLVDVLMLTDPLFIVACLGVLIPNWWLKLILATYKLQSVQNGRPCLFGYKFILMFLPRTLADHDIGGKSSR